MQEAQNAAATVALRKVAANGGDLAGRLAPGFQRLWDLLESTGEGLLLLQSAAVCRLFSAIIRAANHSGIRCCQVGQWIRTCRMLCMI